MADHARSDDAAVQHQLDRLATLSSGRDTPGLERIAALLERLGNPHRKLPPVFHVAGTNGKGSTCAFLRAAIQAAGLSVHVYTSPHLVRFNERIRLADALIDDQELAQLLGEVLDRAEGIDPSFFEATTAAAFLAFSRTPADACIIEVGLGGRLDATNVIEDPLVSGIAHLGIDHEAFLGNDLHVIAGEKAGIAKAGRPLVTQDHAKPLATVIARTASHHGAPWFARGTDWNGAVCRNELHYRDADRKYRLPLPRLAGAHQVDNALLAIAMLSHQSAIPVSEDALKAAMGRADWPARMQQMGAGPLTDLLPSTADLWLDGGHNILAAEALAQYFADTKNLHLVVGMLANKDPAGFLAPLAQHVQSIIFVPIDDHDCHAPEMLVAVADKLGVAAAVAPDLIAAVRDTAVKLDTGNATIAILGSLYLAGEALRLNATIPE